MKTGWTTTGLALALLLTAGCGGGGADLASPTAPLGAVAVAPAKNLVVIRYDHDLDGNPDLLTVDADRRPLEIVEALRGTIDGDAAVATEEFAGQRLAPEIDEALANHLTESFDLDTETELEVKVGGETVTITVIE